MSAFLAHYVTALWGIRVPLAVLVVATAVSVSYVSHKEAR